MNIFFKENSPLYNLPIELDIRILKKFDSLRFTLEMIDFCYLQLQEELYNLSFIDKQRNYPKIFHFAWSIIDYSLKFSKIYKTLNPPEDSPIYKIDYVYHFRSAFQHLDQNIDNRILTNDKPIYGALKWAAKDKENQKRVSCLAISGIFISGSHSIVDPMNKNYADAINDIIIELEPLKKKEKNELNITLLISELAEIVRIIEDSLFKQVTEMKLQLGDWIHRRDILMQFPQENWKKEDDPLDKLSLKIL
jgi:hypothetical protein